MTVQHFLYSGLSVRTADGAKLGSVKEIAKRSSGVESKQSFKIDAPWRRDYWLDAEDIRSVDDAEGVVWLSFTKDELGSHKTKDPSIEWTP